MRQLERKNNTLAELKDVVVKLEELSGDDIGELRVFWARLLPFVAAIFDEQGDLHWYFVTDVEVDEFNLLNFVAYELSKQRYRYPANISLMTLARNVWKIITRAGDETADIIADFYTKRTSIKAYQVREDYLKLFLKLFTPENAFELKGDSLLYVEEYLTPTKVRLILFKSRSGGKELELNIFSPVMYDIIKKIKAVVEK